MLLCTLKNIFITVSNSIAAVKNVPTPPNTAVNASIDSSTSPTVPNTLTPFSNRVSITSFIFSILSAVTIYALA